MNNKEFCQSVPFDYFYNGEYSEKDKVSIDKKEHILYKPTLRYGRIEEFEFSDNYSIIKLNKKFFNGLDLEYGDFNSFIYSKNSKEIIGFDTCELGFSNNNLILNKNSLLDYLEKNNLKMIIAVRGEKGITKNEGNEFLQISGLYYYDEDRKLKGDINPLTKFGYEELHGSFLGIVDFKKNLDVTSEKRGILLF